MRARHAEAVDWIDQALSLPVWTPIPRCASARSACKAGPVGAGARSRPTAVMAEAEAVARELAEPADSLSSCSIPATITRA